MNLQPIEEFFGVKFLSTPGAVRPEDCVSCQFEKGGLRYEIFAIKSENRLYINADPVSVICNATPALELNVQYDEVVFEEYEGIEKGAMFIWKGRKQNLYISRLKNGYSISFGCNT